MPKKWRQIMDGEVVRRPPHHTSACCDCGLVHKWFVRAVKIKNSKIVKVFHYDTLLTPKRDERATAALRRHNRKEYRKVLRRAGLI